MIGIWIPKYNVKFEEPCRYPLGVLYISAVLKKAGYPVTIYNNNLASCRPESLLWHDVVLFTGFEEFMEENIELARRLKKLNRRTILGGAYATFATEDAMKHFDAVIVGEGENAIISALTEDGVHYPDPPQLSTLPLPDYEGLGIDQYHARSAVRYMGVLASRGCPHACTFCSSACKFSMRPLTDVRDEIQLYQDKYKIDMVVMNDNTLNCTKRRFSDFIDMVRPLKTQWSAALRLDNIDADLIRSAKDAGLTYTVIGVESFDQDALDAMNKKITVAQVVAGLDILVSAGIGYVGSLLMASTDDFERNKPYLAKYGLFPTGIKSFIGNNVTDAPKEVHDACRKYALERGTGYYAA